MLTDLQGNPLQEGPTGRSFTLVEHVVKNQSSLSPTWAVEFKGEFELVETIQILAKVIDTFATRHREAVRNERALKEAKTKLMNEV